MIESYTLDGLDSVISNPVTIYVGILQHHIPSFCRDLKPSEPVDREDDSRFFSQWLTVYLTKSKIREFVRGTMFVTESILRSFWEPLTPTILTAWTWPKQEKKPLGRRHAVHRGHGGVSASDEEEHDNETYLCGGYNRRVPDTKSETSPRVRGLHDSYLKR